MSVSRSALLAMVAWGLMSSEASALEQPTFVDGQRVGIELGFGAGWAVDDTAYTQTLETFGFDHWWTSKFRFSAALEGIVLPYFSVLLQTNLLDKREWNRDSGSGPDDHFNWSTWTLDVHLRAFYPPVPWFRVYVQFGVGPTFTSSRLYVRTTTGSGQTKFEEVDVGYNVAGLAGFELSSTHFGFFTQGGYFHAPSPENRLGDRHQSGGGLVLVGISFRFVRSP